MNLVREIPLTQGKIALVDDDDFERVAKYKWCALKRKHTTYAVRTHTINGKQKYVAMHRFIIRPTEENFVDHINGNGLDNRKKNLRECSKRENSLNKGIIKTGLKKSKYKGVRKSLYCDTSWEARIKVNYKTIHLGTFKDELLAAIKYDEAAVIHFGEFAKTNKSMGLL